MNLFRLPISLVKDIHCAYNRFWWGSSDMAKKDPWCSYERICESKVQGGLGFRDIALFNQTMLAKHCWRIVTNPNSLVARVLKGRYFPTSSFLKDDIATKGSYVWRSLVWGRDLLFTGSRWRVGARSSLSIYSDWWLPK